jgi:hypothetical protein
MSTLMLGLLLVLAKLAVLRMLSRLPRSACMDPTSKAA